MSVVITSIAAAAAVIVAFLQWKTAQTKLALDIHATRYAIYQDLRDAVSQFLTNLNFSNDVHGKFLDAQSRARFHFGAEVDQYLERLRSDMIWLVLSPQERTFVPMIHSKPRRPSPRHG